MKTEIQQFPAALWLNLSKSQLFWRQLVKIHVDTLIMIHQFNHEALFKNILGSNQFYESVNEVTQLWENTRNSGS